MEIERKFLVSSPPEEFRRCPFHQIEQAYLCTGPVVRIRREDQSYYLTYKSQGTLSRKNTTCLLPPRPIPIFWKKPTERF